MKVAALFSGGKDSTYALWCTQLQGWDVTTLVTMFPEVKDSWMFHYPAITWTRLQAELLGLPQYIISTKGFKETELEDLSAGLESLKQRDGLDGIVSGAVASEYQRTRLDNICERLGIRSFAPLWHKNPQQLVNDEIESGLEFVITACSALGLDRDWLGRRIGAKELEQLVGLSKRFGLNVAFEGGEAETFVLRAPNFGGSLSIGRTLQHWNNDSGYLELEDVSISEQR